MKGCHVDKISKSCSKKENEYLKEWSNMVISRWGQKMGTGHWGLEYYS
jgi:hypothetical protein